MKPGNYFRHIRIAVKTLIFRCIELAKKYREIIVYVIFGGLTTAVDFGAYTVLSKLFHINDSVSNVISWFAAVIFAYITNKLFVFESKGKGVGKLLYEFGTFFAARAFTGVVYTGGFALMTGVWGVNDYLSKALLSVFNIVVNYIFSKLVTFRKKSTSEKAPAGKQEKLRMPEVRNGGIIIGGVAEEKKSDESDAGNGESDTGGE